MKTAIAQARNGIQWTPWVHLDDLYFADDLQSSTKVLARLPTFAVSVMGIYQFAPSPQFNVVYRDEVVIARFQHCQGGRGFLIPVMPLVIVSKVACQRMFQLSDPGVPRTFVEDCLCVTRRDYDMFSGKIRKSSPCFV